MLKTESVSKAPASISVGGIKLMIGVLDLDRYLFARYALPLGVLVLLLSVWGYQPAYFGDELFPFYVAKTSSSIGEVFLRINEYKPRLVFNGIWTVLAWERAPRLVVAILNGLAMWSAAVAAFAVSHRGLRTSAKIAFVVGLSVLISRFGVVFYFDYLSGMIGTLGLALFLCNLLVLSPMLNASAPNVRRAAFSVLLAILNVFVYETYIAPLFVLGIAMAYFALKDGCLSSGERKTTIVAGLMIWLLPLVLFVIATRFLSTLSVATGTAGQPVSVGIDTIPVVLHFASNTFLGTNFGHGWFTGFFNAESEMGGRIGLIFALSLGFLWAASFKCAWRRMTRENVILLIAVFLMGMSTIAISSLPGEAKADARWMFPMSAFVAFLIVALPYTLPRNILLAALLGVSVFHLAAGSARGIYNVIGSQISGRIGNALESVVPVGGRGLVLGLPKSDMEWIIGGDALQDNDASSGAVYCWANLGHGPCVDPESALTKNSLNSYDFALVFPSGNAPTQRPYLVPHGAISALIAPTPALLDDAKMIGGARTGWSSWAWQPVPLTDMVDPIFSSERIGTLRLDAGDLSGRLIAYQAYTDLAGQGSTMRLQINWLDRNSRLVSAQIKLVELTSNPDVYTMLMDRPIGAVSGEIYVALHAPGHGTAHIKSIAIKQL